MALRMAGIAIGAHYGVTEAVIGLMFAQIAATGILGLAGLEAFHRFPHAARTSLGSHRGGILRFVVQSSLATGVVSLRGPLRRSSSASSRTRSRSRISASPRRRRTASPRSRHRRA